MTIKDGDIIETKCFFTREIVEEFHDLLSPPVKVKRWKPGVVFGHDAYDEWSYAHGVGLSVHEVVNIVKLPRPYHKRVFFKRHFVTPDFESIKTKGLMVCSIQSFKWRTTSFEDRYRSVIDIEPFDSDENIETDFDVWKIRYEAHALEQLIAGNAQR